MSALDTLRDNWAAFTNRWRRTWAGLPRPAKWGVMALVLIFFVALPNLTFPGIDFFVTQETDWATTLFTVSYYVLLAIGLNVVVGLAGLLDLGYVGFFAVGAYTVAVLTSPDSDLDLKWAYLAAVPVAIALAALSGLILGWPTLRLRGDYLAIVTLGFAEIIRIAADSSSFLKGDRGISSIPPPPGTKGDGMPLFGVTDARPYYWLALAVIVVILIGVRNLERSRVGRAWVAIREDEDAAEAMGVPTFKFKLWAFAIGASIGGLSGALFVGEQGFINSSTFQLQFSILVLAGVVMGGAGNLPGVILGGALIAYLPERFRGIKIAGTDAFEYRYMFFGLVLILVMIFRPQGLIPSRRRAAEFIDRKKEATPVE
ncbi:branched-chain amino acid ABC transporter permease [Cryptosporangium sp. NPDC051539]|uniref:branched-chain amino acid ABC transporter permease n=1 Tax=Cryptosporangium sp. NPDC051539 TaxID=3363962 RepID=UPI0037A94229